MDRTNECGLASAVLHLSDEHAGLVCSHVEHARHGSLSKVIQVTLSYLVLVIGSKWAFADFGLSLARVPPQDPFSIPSPLPSIFSLQLVR